jgi:carboxyl-terminal processing protease
VIVHLVEGGPALRAGLRPGDALLAVDGVAAATLASHELVDLVRGAPGSPVSLRLDRPGAPESVEVVIEREVVEVPLLEWRLLPRTAPGAADIGYVQLRGFARSVEPALPGVLGHLHAQGAGAWVLDLRDNGGGDVGTFARAAGLFIPEGPLGVTVDRQGLEAVIAAEPQGAPAAHEAFAQPLAVLVNGRTASAAELLAADLQEYGVGRVFGTTTAGCFGNSQLFRLPDGTALWLTVRALQSGRARRDVHQLGVTPDEAILQSRADLASGRDPQLARALAWLRESLPASGG